MRVTPSDLQAGYLFTWLLNSTIHQPRDQITLLGFPVLAGPVSQIMRPHVTWPLGALKGDRPLPYLHKGPTMPRFGESHLPREEPTDADDAQNVKHSRAHDGPHAHVALGDEDS